MNSRWELYKQANNIKSDEGVKGWNYVIWIDDMWLDWCKITKRNYNEPKNESEHKLFDEWLRNEVAKCG